MNFSTSFLKYISVFIFIKDKFFTLEFVINYKVNKSYVPETSDNVNEIIDGIFFNKEKGN